MRSISIGSVPSLGLGVEVFGLGGASQVWAGDFQSFSGSKPFGPLKDSERFPGIAGSFEEPRQLDGGCVQHLAADAREGGELDRGPQSKCRRSDGSFLCDLWIFMGMTDLTYPTILDKYS